MVYAQPQVANGTSVLSFPNDSFRRVYQDVETRNLDGFFGLEGKPVRKDAQDLLGMAEKQAILDGPVTGKVAAYMIVLAQKYGNFVGVPEEELRTMIRSRTIVSLKEPHIDETLRYKGRMNGGQCYLRRVNVDGINVLFPGCLV